MNANERLIATMHEIGHKAGPQIAVAIFEALDTWHLERMREIKAVSAWFGEIGRTIPMQGIPLPPSPSELHIRHHKAAAVPVRPQRKPA